MGETVGFVGVTGGAGTTRTCVELAATLARDGRDVAVIDAAYGTQGLSTHVEGRIEPDLTRTLLEDRAIEAAYVEPWDGLEGTVHVAPAHAPFERIARAKTPDAAEALERAIRRAADDHDHVLVDVPPLAANQAVGAATTVDRLALVAPATSRGADLLPRMRGRVVDVGADVDGVVVTRAETDDPAATPLAEADAAIPADDVDAIRPAALGPDDTVAPAVADAAERLLDVELTLSFEESSGLLG